MEKNLVSIIIPCFNHGKFLDEAISSCLKQTYENIEIIIVNDCSTDPFTIELLRNLSYSKTKLINHERNKGVAAARNTGIQHSSGCYILALDADDTIEPQFLEKTVPILEKNSSVGFVGTGIRHFGNEDREYIPPPFSFYKLLYHNLYIVTSLFRKEAWEQVGGFNEAFIYGYEDWDFWISLAKKGWMGDCVPEILFNYRSHGKSKIHEAKGRHHYIVSQIIANHRDLYREEFMTKLKASEER